MYIPSLFSTSPNGCPSGSNAYSMVNAGTSNLNTGVGGRITVTINQFTNEFVGENYQGQGTYTTDIQLANGESFSTTGIMPPSTFLQLPFWGSSGQNQTFNNITSSAGQNLYYCYECTRKWRYTIGSRLCGGTPPWPSSAIPLKLAVLTNPTGSITNLAHYTAQTFNFCTGTTGSIEGFGPIWYDQSGGSNNAAGYYIISREDITPTFYGIQNCLTSSVTRSISLSSTQTLNVGDVFQSSTSTLSGSCWSVTSSFQSSSFTPNVSNVVTSSTFASCINCTDPLTVKYNITDCDTSTNYVATFSSVPTLGTIFKSNDLEKCFTIVSQATQSVTSDYSNLSIIQTYADCATCLATSGSLLISSLVVGGGGAGGGYQGGGGGGGQYQSSTDVSISLNTTYSVVVGAGGTASTFEGTNGGSSSFNGVTSIGGGAGGSYPSAAGNSGSSGGGGSSYLNGAGGTGTAGNNGGNGTNVSNDRSGGGGGSSQIGTNGSSTSNGGSGSLWLDGIRYAGGGGGGRSVSALESANGLGGPGGGGNGYQYGGVPNRFFRVPTSGTPNTGGGGGGANTGQGTTGSWDGGSGVVKIRYAASSSIATGGDITISGSFVYHTFTGSGNFIT